MDSLLLNLVHFAPAAFLGAWPIAVFHPSILASNGTALRIVLFRVALLPATLVVAVLGGSCVAFGADVPAGEGAAFIAILVSAVAGCTLALRAGAAASSRLKGSGGGE
jgi:hypothetical protein